MNKRSPKYARYLLIFFLLFILWWMTKLIGCGHPVSQSTSETTTTTGMTTTTTFAYPSGNLDTSFSDGTNSGYAVNKGVAGSDSSDTVYAIAIDSEGKIIAAGSAMVGIYPGTNYMFLLKYNSDGSFDASFGSGGKLAVTATAGANYNDSGNAVAIDPLDNILVAGRSIDPNSSASAGAMVIWRYKKDGTLDTAFAGGTGKILQALSDYHIIYPYAIALDPSGKIVVAGNATAKTFPGDGDLFVARYNSDGTLDTSFTDDTHPGFSLFEGAVGTDSTEYGYSIAFDPAGNILVGGSATSPDFASRYVAVYKFKSDGKMDTGFGDGTHSGYSAYKDTLGDNSADFGQSIAIDAAGKIYVAGYCIGNYGTMNETRSMAIWKFGSDGRKESAVTYTAATSEGNAMVFDKAGKILVVGKIQPLSSSDIGIWRYATDGSIDNSFGNNGVVDFDTTSTLLGHTGSNVDVGNALALDREGRIVIGGYTGGALSYSSIILRYK